MSEPIERDFAWAEDFDDSNAGDGRLMHHDLAFYLADFREECVSAERARLLAESAEHTAKAVAAERERVLDMLEDAVTCSCMREPEREHVNDAIARLRAAVRT